ncbi:cyclic nucleotide-binding domain protein (macronuclear) [Tetrahymena thermophila SB210]|uniref:Cyclic nucleotide-binding domain protein n=1 Tax=Tetrahymena thermophila (strain SB210) TaxID=312017 RepID=Q23KB7_TETTS|nr:cyclic nucleotide-binding domain protein [Tetrahymena thermophila SB210]EAR96926.2 cyclic nucleotide-binding domain protein [Tetrahymena thermophila SB210]|eukprot:XP_001017171.2 cyclic nucleotide-binding domain protein [Tetrahymena thermophila SB210]
MTTLGYGDITPKTEIEQVFATSVGLLSTVIFAFSVSLIGEILKDISKRSSEFRSQMGKIETYLNKRKLNQKLKVKVRKYFGYLNKEQQEDTNEGVQLLQKLASSLKEEVFIDMYGRLLKSKKLFDLHFSQRFLNQLALKMKEMRFGPEEIIFRESDPGNKMYFILKGEVQMMLNMKQESQSYHNLCNLKEGQIFGEIEFFSGQTRENCARAVNVTDLVYVEYDDFIETVKLFPEDYEQVLQTKDNLNLYQKSKGLDHKCFSCSSYDHRLKQCPLVNFIPNKVKILHNFNLDHYQERSNQQQRKDFRSHKTLKQAQYLKQCVMRLHFKLYNEQLQNEFENSQFDFEGYSDENSIDSYPSVYQQNSQQVVQKQKSTAIEKGFILNNSFIAAETPKHQQRLSKLNTLLLRGASKHFSRSSTNKAGISWSQNEHNSNGTHACLKQDSKSKFYKQTNFNTKVNSDDYQFNQSPQQKSIKLQNDQKENHQSQKNEYVMTKTEMPFIASPPISNIHNKSMKEEFQNDDYNNLNPQMNILSNQFNENFHKQNLKIKENQMLNLIKIHLRKKTNQVLKIQITILNKKQIIFKIHKNT